MTGLAWCAAYLLVGVAVVWCLARFQPIPAAAKLATHPGSAAVLVVAWPAIGLAVVGGVCIGLAGLLVRHAAARRKAAA